MLKRLWVVISLSLLLPNLGKAELMDPTRPPDFIPGGDLLSGTMHVDAIVYSKERKIAVINGLPLKEGDQLAGNRLIEIQENIVQFDGPSGKIILNLVREPIKKKGSAD